MLKCFLTSNNSQVKHSKTHLSFNNLWRKIMRQTSTTVLCVKDFPTNPPLLSETMWSPNISQTHSAIPVIFVEKCWQAKAILCSTGLGSIWTINKSKRATNIVSIMLYNWSMIILPLHFTIKQYKTNANPVPGQVFEDPSELLQFVRKDPTDKKFYCTLCENFSHKARTMTGNHVESQHFPNSFSYPCDLCGDVLTTKSHLWLHRSRKHLNKKQNSNPID